MLTAKSALAALVAALAVASAAAADPSRKTLELTADAATAEMELGFDSEGARRRRNFAQLGLGEIRMAIYRRYAQRLSHAFKQGVRRHGYDHHLMYLVAQGQHKSQVSCT